MNSNIRAGIILLLMLCTAACWERQELKAEKASAGDVQPVKRPIRAKSLNIDTSKSVIHWRATKMLRTAGHEGTLQLKEGNLLFRNDTLIGGKIIADMNTIRIINTSAYKKSTMRGLTNYLRKRAFEAGKFPFASFEITRVKYLDGDSLLLWGNMRIKDVRKNISVPVSIGHSGGRLTQFTTQFSLERTTWNIGSGGNLLENNLVDEDFALRIMLKAENF